MRLGMIGLGRMGGNMAERLRQHGHEVVGYDPHSDATDVKSLEELATALGDPGTRIAWTMVPAGDITESTINQLGDLLAEGDLVIDGGNSNWEDSRRRGEALAAKGVHFIDCGTSGGVWGLENGYCLMVGGAPDDVARAQPIFDALAPEGGFAHAGKVGTGHFTKMVHNGVEYGLMQAYAEGYEILDRCGLDIDAHGVLGAWRYGSVVRSWLLELLVAALERTPHLQGIKDVAADSGEGRWTVNEAVRLGVSAPVISAALFARFVSQEDSNTAMKVIAALRNEFGGHAIEVEG
jgi:6-phosphogluconate dehydrogenase